jgi:AmmeMemoRadiSam system protein A/AmmeMemoRadiSam system protein B
MVPEVGREAVAEVRGSIDAMREFTRRIIQSRAETIVLVSPHAPLEARAFVAYHDAQLYGDFANFRAPEAVVEAPLDEELLTEIARTASEQGYEVLGIKGYYLDHGTAVPLYFLLRNGWRGSLVALGYSFLSNEDHLHFGACIRRAVERAGRPIALVASGDLSHRLKPGAPAGYNADAHLFDEEVVASLRACEPARIVNIDQDLRKLAGECGYRSMLIALGAGQGILPTCDVLHYEAPFGVGYLVAQLTREQEEEGKQEESSESKEENEQGWLSSAAPMTASTGEELPALACLAIETFVREGRVIETPSSPSALLQARAACFVSIKTDEGALRGCIGTIEPLRENLAEELIANAISAATRDPRFPPVKAVELSHLRYSVDVLSEPEPARFEELDPAIYGVIVEDEAGLNRGLLLPDIEGIETVSQQVEIAMRKAGIAKGTPLRLFRFRVERFRESTQHHEPSENREDTNGRR